MTHPRDPLESQSSSQSPEERLIDSGQITESQCLENPRPDRVGGAEPQQYVFVYVEPMLSLSPDKIVQLERERSSMGLWNKLNPSSLLVGASGLPDPQPQGSPLTGWSSYMPRENVETTAKKERGRSNSTSTLGETSKSASQPSSRRSRSSVPKTARTQRRSATLRLQKSTRPPGSSSASLGQILVPQRKSNWNPVYPQQNEPWRVTMPPASEVPAGPSASDINTNVGLAQPDAFRFQGLNITGQQQVQRIHVPQFPPPWSNGTLHAAICFDIANAASPGVSFRELEGNFPGLINGDQPVLEGMGPGGIVLWITWPGYPQWKDRLAVTRNYDQPIKLRELGRKVVAAYRRFVNDYSGMQNYNGNAWHLGGGGITLDQLVLTKLNCVGGIHWRADVDLVTQADA